MLRAKDIMTTEVLAVAKDADIYRAIRMMVENNVTGLPVIASDRTLAGVVTEKDVLKLLYDVEDRPGKVEDFMTKAVIAFDQETDVGIVADGLAANHFRRVPILNHGRLVGIISRKDVIKHIKEQWLTEKAPA